MKLLTFTSLYPNEAMPGHGVFVANRLQHLVANGQVSATVIAPVPWFPRTAPFTHERFGRFGRFARVPAREVRDGIEILHPRYFTVPALGALFVPLAMALAARTTIAARVNAGETFDAIDAHYFFPDGVAAALLGRWFGLPVVITARGSDINQIAQHPVAKPMVMWAARQAARLITVSRALRDALVAMGIDGEKVEVLRNGVDTERFVPIDRAAARRQLGVDAAGPTIVSVGRLVKPKGHDLVIEALTQLPGVRLLIAGGGPDRALLEAHARKLGVTDRVVFLGERPHHELACVYASADALVLASANEGWPNVLLESMACGTPAVVTNVGGTAEVVSAPEAGRVVDERSVPAIASALRTILANPPDRASTRRYAEGFSWDETTRGQERVFAAVSGVAHDEELLEEAA